MDSDTFTCSWPNNSIFFTDPEDLDSPEPGQGSGTQRRPGVGIIRRKRVSKVIFVYRDFHVAVCTCVLYMYMYVHVHIYVHVSYQLSAARTILSITHCTEYVLTVHIFLRETNTCITVFAIQCTCTTVKFNSR